MSYPAYGQYPVARKKRGMKRIVFGILGILANIVGLFVMPIIAGVVMALVAAMGAMGNEQDLDPAGGTIQMESTKTYIVYVPTDEVSSSTCTFDGVPASNVHKEDTPTDREIDGTSYSDAYQVTSPDESTVTVTCQGASSVKYAEIGVLSTLIGAAVGLLIPVALGVLSLILLIWGIVARVRS